MLEAREAVRRLKQYQPPLGDRSGLRLDFNENTGGCSPRVLERLRQLQPEQTGLLSGARAGGTRSGRRFWDCNRSRLLLTNGVDEAIHLVCRGISRAGRRCSDCGPDIRHVPDLHGGNWSDRSFRFLRMRIFVFLPAK